MATIELEVKKIYPDISKSEQRAADFFLNNKEAIFHYPLATLAKMSKTSQGAWVRFCKSLGYDGMKSLKKRMMKMQLNFLIFMNVPLFPLLPKMSATAVHQQSI